MINNRVRELRKKQGLTLEELAKKLGVSYSAVQKLDAGSVDMDTKWMQKLSQVFNVKPYELLPKEWQPEEITPEERQILDVIRKNTGTQKADNTDILEKKEGTENNSISSSFSKQTKEQTR